MMNFEMGKAYWIPVPANYLTAVGAVTAQWGYFEMQFGGFITILSRCPDAGVLLAADAQKKGFQNKSKTFRRMARIAFADTPSLAEKICDFAVRAAATARKRNILIHGYWFDRTPFDENAGVIIATEGNGTGDVYAVKLKQIEALAEKITDLKLEGTMLLFPVSGDHTPYLTPEELPALLEFHEQYPAPALGAGGPDCQPTPFLA